jgi:phosphohistidine phosphatase
MRHAKSDPTDHQIKEQEWPLTEKGARRAAEMGAWMLARELLPQLILTSTAARTCQTAQLAARASGYHGEIKPIDGLYMAEADEIIRMLRGLPDELERVMVVGHNPGLESMIPLLTEQIVSLPPAGIAYLSLPVEHWKDLTIHTEAELVEHWRPKETQGQAEPVPTAWLIQPPEYAYLIRRNQDTVRFTRG